MIFIRDEIDYVENECKMVRWGASYHERAVV